MLVVLGGFHVRQLRSRVDQRLHCREIVCANRLDETPNGRAVDVRLELGPAVESVRSRQHELRVVQLESFAICVAIARAHLRNGIGVAGAKRGEELFCLTPELVEHRIVATFSSDGRSPFRGHGGALNRLSYDSGKGLRLRGSYS